MQVLIGAVGVQGRKSWCFLFCKGSVGGICAPFVAAGARQRAQGWEFLFTKAQGTHNCKGRDFRGANTLAKPWSFCLLRAEPVPHRAKGSRDGAHPAHPSGLGSSSISSMEPSALSDPRSCLCFVICASGAGARGSCWQQSMFPHGRKRSQTSVLFLRAVNNAAGGSSVAARSAHALTEPWPQGAGGWEMLRKPGLSLHHHPCTITRAPSPVLHCLCSITRASSPVHHHPCTAPLAQPAAVSWTCGHSWVSEPRWGLLPCSVVVGAGLRILGGGSAKGGPSAAHAGDRLRITPWGCRQEALHTHGQFIPSIVTPAASFSFNSSSPLPGDVFIA